MGREFFPSMSALITRTAYDVLQLTVAFVMSQNKLVFVLILGICLCLCEIYELFLRVVYILYVRFDVTRMSFSLLSLLSCCS